MDPFDFNLKKEQHLDLYQSGQLCVHMHASMYTEHLARLAGDDASLKAGKERADLTMSPEARLKTIYSILNLNYPS